MPRFALAAVLSAALLACGSPALQSALDVIRPAAVDMLTDLVRERYGSEPDTEGAICFELPEGFGDDDGFVYIMCRAKPVEQ